MMPYFFAAGDFNYARYGLCYINSMEKLPKDTLESFLKGEHVMRHKRGAWNSIWSDTMIETTYMKFGKGPGGIIGVTTQPRTLKIWAKSQHIQNKLLSDLKKLRNKDENPN